jgi:nucleoside 2-deoxyribosyltransferase
MKTIYLCGPIDGCNDAQCKDWRNYVKEQLKDVFNFRDPMVRDFRGNENDHINEIVELDKIDIVSSDILIVNTDRPSWGTAMEIIFAKMLGKKVYFVWPHNFLSPWVIYHSDERYKTLDEAIRHIRLMELHPYASGT